MAPLPHLPPHSSRNDGEVIVLIYDGTVYRLRMDEARTVMRWAFRLAEGLHDDITRAGGIEPRSGEPI